MCYRLASVQFYSLFSPFHVTPGFLNQAAKKPEEVEEEKRKKEARRETKKEGTKKKVAKDSRKRSERMVVDPDRSLEVMKTSVTGIKTPVDALGQGPSAGEDIFLGRFLCKSISNLSYAYEVAPLPFFRFGGKEGRV